MINWSGLPDELQTYRAWFVGYTSLRTFLAMSEIVANSQMRGLSTRYMGWLSNKVNGWSYSSARLSMRSLVNGPVLLAFLANGLFDSVRSTGQCNTFCSLSAGVSKPKVFRGR